MMKRLLAVMAATCLLAVQAVAAPPTWTVNQAKSSLTFLVGVNGQQVKGKFDAFGSQIVFDPSDLAASHVKVTMDMSGVKTGDRTRDVTLMKPVWFDVLGFPQAVFEARTFVAKGGNAYEARGTLRLKGITRPVTLPFTLVIKGRTALMTGETTLNRIDFGVGSKNDDSEEVSVTPDVKVMVNITATRAN